MAEKKKKKAAAIVGKRVVVHTPIQKVQLGEIDLNVLAKAVTKAEGLKVQVNIAQVKEILRIVIEQLAEHSVWQVVRLLEEKRKELDDWFDPSWLDNDKW